MNEKLLNLDTPALQSLLDIETKKFLLALDYGSTASDLEEIKEQIDLLKQIISIRNTKSSLLQ